MSRRERDARDSYGKRLHSRFDREPSPKKLKRYEKYEKPEVNVTHSSHRHFNLTETTSHEQKQRPIPDDALLEATPVSRNQGFQNEKRDQERKGDKPPVGTKHSSDIREVSHSRSFYQHDDRSSTGQGGQNLSRRPLGITDHRRLNDMAKEEAKDQPKKDERSLSHADDKNSVWRHDRFYEMESKAPPARKRPAFREKKVTSEPEVIATAMGTDNTKLQSTGEQSELSTGKRERGGFYPRELDKPDKRERRGDGFYHRGEMHRNADIDQSREGYGGMRGRTDRFDTRYSERELNRVGGFEAEKWKHDLFDEANQSPPPKNEEEQIARVEALLAS